MLRKRRSWVIAYLLAMTLCNLILALRLMPMMRNGYQDFTIFYTGGRLLRSGQASALYDLAAQYRMQQSFSKVPIRLGALPFNHPPFEALLFVPFTLLAYWPAYLLWTALNLFMLAVSAILLRTQLRQFSATSPLLLGVGTAAFFPTARALIQGQDVILLLLCFVLAIICLDRDKDVAAGALLGLSLFRPQFAVPVVLLLAIRRWRILLGFAGVAVMLGGITVAIVGWRGPLDYVQFVIRLEGSQARAFGPEILPNLRGLIAEIPGLSAVTTQVLIFVASIIVFVTTARRIRNGQDSILFVASLAVVTTLLINFHSLVYDLSLLLPMSLFLLFRASEVGAGKADVATAILLFLTPLYIFLLLMADSFYLFSFVLLWLFLKLLLTPAPAEALA
jgi:alpha-1,2-mannosyltransferase